MASLSKDKTNATYTVQFTGPHGTRPKVRLGKVNKKTAESVKTHVEHLAAARLSGLPLDSDTAAWVGKIGPDLADKLAAVGLIARRHAATLGEFLAGYLDRRRANSKGTTVLNIRQVCRDLEAMFGAATDVRSVTPAMADDLATDYAKRLANQTAARRLRVCRMLFDVAVRHKLTDANPFADVKGPPDNPDAERQEYVGRAAVLKVIGVCSPEWQLIAALSRFAGLRAPSEVFLLKWCNVDLVGGRFAPVPAMLVRSPKTEHHAGGESCVVPIFPDLRPFLVDAFDRAGDAGAEFVVNGVGERGRAKMLASPNGWTAVNLSVPFGKMIERAGCKAWPKPLHNMRASCQTDLTNDFPEHVVCEWLGNSQKVARKHYLKTTDDVLRRAVEMPATPRPTALERTENVGAESGSPVVQNAGQTRRPRTAWTGQQHLEQLGFMAIWPRLTDRGLSGPVIQMPRSGLEPETR